MAKSTEDKFLQTLELRIMDTVAECHALKLELNDAINVVTSTIDIIKQNMDRGKVPTPSNSTQGNEWRIYHKQFSLEEVVNRLGVLQQLREQYMELYPEAKSTIKEEHLKFEL